MSFGQMGKPYGYTRNRAHKMQNYTPNQAQPRLNQAQPRLNQAQPRLNQAQPRLNQAQPRLNQAQPRSAKIFSPPTSEVPSTSESETRRPLTSQPQRAAEVRPQATSVWPGPTPRAPPSSPVKSDYAGSNHPNTDAFQQGLADQTISTEVYARLLTHAYVRGNGSAMPLANFVRLMDSIVEMEEDAAEDHSHVPVNNPCWGTEEERKFDWPL